MGTSGQIAKDAALGRPAVRAKFLQLWLSSFERTNPVSLARLDQIVGEEKRRAIMELSMLSWVPIELDIEIVDAVAQVLGKPQFREFTRAYVSEIMPRAPLGALIDLGTKMIGVSPESFLRWWDKGWRAVYRDCGTARGIVSDATHGRIIYEKLPRACVQSEAFVDAIVSTSYAVYAWTGQRGSARIATFIRDEGYLELKLEWGARS